MIWHNVEASLVDNDNTAFFCKIQSYCLGGQSNLVSNTRPKPVLVAIIVNQMNDSSTEKKMCRSVSFEYNLDVPHVDQNIVPKLYFLRRLLRILSQPMLKSSAAIIISNIGPAW